MIEILRAAYPSAKQWEMAIDGMRNPKNSWDRSDSFICYGETTSEVEPTEGLCLGCPNSTHYMDSERLDDLENVTREDFEFKGCINKPLIGGPQFRLGEKDLKLAKNLISLGDEHAKFLRMIPIYIDIRAPLSWWKQFDTYSHVVKNSSSTMHTLMDKPFKTTDFSLECVVEAFKEGYVDALNELRNLYIDTGEKEYWEMTEGLLFQSYNQLRTVYTNYAVLFKICAQRAGHKKDEWDRLISWILEFVPYFKELCYDKLCKVSASFNERFGPNKEGK